MPLAHIYFWPHTIKAWDRVRWESDPLTFAELAYFSFFFLVSPTGMAMAEPMQSIMTAVNFIVTAGGEDKDKGLNRNKAIKARWLLLIWCPWNMEINRGTGWDSYRFQFYSSNIPWTCIARCSSDLSCSNSGRTIERHGPKHRLKYQARIPLLVSVYVSYIPVHLTSVQVVYTQSASLYNCTIMGATDPL